MTKRKDTWQDVVANRHADAKRGRKRWRVGDMRFALKAIAANWPQEKYVRECAKQGRENLLWDATQLRFSVRKRESDTALLAITNQLSRNQLLRRLRYRFGKKCPILDRTMRLFDKYSAGDIPLRAKAKKDRNNPRSVKDKVVLYRDPHTGQRREGVVTHSQWPLYGGAALKGDAICNDPEADNAPKLDPSYDVADHGPVTSTPDKPYVPTFSDYQSKKFDISGLVSLAGECTNEEIWVEMAEYGVKYSEMLELLERHRSELRREGLTKHQKQTMYEGETFLVDSRNSVMDARGERVRAGDFVFAPGIGKRLRVRGIVWERRKALLSLDNNGSELIVDANCCVKA